MSRPVITVENLSKAYRIGLREAIPDTFVGALTGWMTAPLKNFWRLRSLDVRHAAGPTTNGRQPTALDTQQSATPQDIIWALKDVSFEVHEGEVLGIIGRNGAGKSTLLKILSRITEPTSGRAVIRGRVSSLLEVGTGFHPELTGRENIYMNGTILGMTRREIDHKFDEIVDFSGVETFLDTPIKRYSSGMRVRLAFAVAAHLEPEILIVDEVLAVGDAEFQKKCLGKMGEIGREGRTVLIVSHNMPSILNLCIRAVLLYEGHIVQDGLSADVVSHYLERGKDSASEVKWKDASTAPGTCKVRLHAVRIVCDGKVTSNIDIQKEFAVEIEFWNLKSESRLSTSIHLKDSLGTNVLASANLHSSNLVIDEWFDQPYPVGLFRTVCRIPGNFLNEGRYTINAFVLSNISQFEVSQHDLVSFTVYDTGAMRKEYSGPWIGVVRPRLAWNTEYLTPLNAKACVAGITEEE